MLRVHGQPLNQCARSAMVKPTWQPCPPIHEDQTLTTFPETDPVKTPRTKAAATPKTAKSKAKLSPAALAKAAAEKKTTAGKKTAARSTGTAAKAEVQAPSAILSLAAHALEEMKAEETIIIELEGKTSLADQMIITSGRSSRHVGSIADEVVKSMKDAGYGTPRVEGVPHCDWVLIDCGDVIVHVFRPEVRQFYNLEKMWGVDRPTELEAG